MAQRDSWPAVRWLLATACALSASVALAQVDTPAASAARAANRQLRQTYGDSPLWSQWSRQLNLPDVRYELRAGERAEPETLREAATLVQSARAPEFSATGFQQWAKALTARADELVWVPASEWPAACRQQAEQFVEITPERVEAARQTLLERLRQFELRYPQVREPQDVWRTFLLWPELQAALNVPGPAPERDRLDLWSLRWKNATIVWEDDALFEASLAVIQYLQCIRAGQVGETREQHAGAWNELAELLGSNPADVEVQRKVALAVHAREQLGQGSRLTASIRRVLSRPNVIVQTRIGWLKTQMAQTVDEPVQVDGVFAGTRSTGSGRLRGTMRADIFPSAAVGQLLLRFDAVSTARTVGSEDRVRVVSRGSTTIAGAKPFALDAAGMSQDPAVVSARSAIVYESIDSEGFARRRSRAESETYARRPQAQADSAAFARRSTSEELNKQGSEFVNGFNRSYQADFRDPRIRADRPGPVVRVRASGEQLRWEGLLAGQKSFGAPSAPPVYEVGTDVVMCLSPSALEEQAYVTLAGKKLSGEELLKAIGPALGAKVEDQPAPQDFSVTFEQRPCEVRMVDGAIHARLFIANFTSGDVDYPSILVDVEYKPEPRDGQIVFVRQGQLRAKPMPGPDGETSLSGRQQTLRLAVQRKLGKVLAAELSAPKIEIPLGEGQGGLKVVQARVVPDWLQFGLVSESGPAKVREF